ncbi:hypothetical protein GR28A_00187 [Vibrio phage vB_VcorM_GR28A]|nr:hypothetical protein GR28A_00187 [Vibrio phage vB_VcorM_GR28A]
MQLQLISAKELAELFSLQVELNAAYNMGGTPPICYALSADREWSEFLDECEGYWKFYATNPNTNREKALFELVDCVHFIISQTLALDANAVLHVQGTAKNYFSELPDVAFGDIGCIDLGNVSKDDMLELIMSLKSQCLVNIPSMRKLADLSEFITLASNLIGYSIDEYMHAHRLKNRQNHRRATHKAETGDYGKANEKPLSLEDEL